MTPSCRASRKRCASVSAIMGRTGKRAKLGEQDRLEGWRLLSAATSLRRLAAASMLALAFGPATALAAPASHHAHLPAANLKRNTPRAHDSIVSRGGAVGATLLALGSGYDSPRGSAPVRALQRLLARQGEEPGPIDGRFGPLTERAVLRFQVDHGLGVDGIAGTHTLAALSSPSPVVYPGAGYGDPIGSRPVRALQRLLVRAGDQPGPIDGRYGPLTERAVMRFQADHGLEVDRIAGERTFARLLEQTHAYRSQPRPTGSRPRPANHRSGRSPRTTNVRHISHPMGWPAVVLLVLLAGLGLVALLTTARYTRPRRSERLVDQPKRLLDGPKTATSGNNAVTTSSGNRALLLERRASPGVAWWAQPAVSSAKPASIQGEDEDDPRVMFKRGVLFESEGNLDEAEAAYRRADQRGHAAAACNLGALLEELGDRDGAKVAYLRADRRSDADGAFNLGALLERQGDLDEAKAAYRRADRRGHAAAACNLGVLLEQRGDLTGAEAAYRRADQRGDACGALNLGGLLAERNELVIAEAAYRRAEERGHADVANLARVALAGLAVTPVGTNGSKGGASDVQ